MKLGVAIPNMLDSGIQRLKLEFWVAAQNSAQRRTNPTSQRYHGKEHLWEFVDASHIQDRKLVYLEFGVYRGASMRYWLGLNKNPESRFIGFDSFEGLPEAWKWDSLGTFDLGGAIPDIEDTRCSFVKGSFEDTLEPYLARLAAEPDFDDYVLFVNLDADLYASTVCAWSALAPLLTKRRTQATIVYFDEFREPRHEFKAYSEFAKSRKFEFAFLGQAENYWRVAFKVSPPDLE